MVFLVLRCSSHVNLVVDFENVIETRRLKQFSMILTITLFILLFFVLYQKAVKKFSNNSEVTFRCLKNFFILNMFALLILIYT